MGAPKGTRPPAAGIGRTKGSPNLVTRDIREMLRESLEGVGGVRYLMAQAEKNPASYMALIGKIVPQQIDATIRRELPEMTRAELLELLNSADRARHALPQRLAPAEKQPVTIEHEK
jgi:hypothetical protein